MKNQIRILSNKILIKRREHETPTKIILPENEVSHYKGEVILYGNDVPDNIDISKRDIIVYDKYPEILKINSISYDLIGYNQIKFIIKNKQECLDE